MSLLVIDMRDASLSPPTHSALILQFSALLGKTAKSMYTITSEEPFHLPLPSAIINHLFIPWCIIHVCIHNIQRTL